MRKLGALLAIAMVALIGNTAQASITAEYDGLTISFVENDGVSAVLGEGYRTWDLVVDVPEGSDWTNAQIWMELDQGSFYYEPAYGDLTPQQGFWGFVPELEYSSFCAVPPDFSASVSFAGAHPDHPAPADRIYTDTVLSAAWFDTADTGAGTYTVGRFTWTEDAAGTILELQNYASAEEFEGPMGPDVWIEGGAVIPEPATMSLLAVGGVAALIRRKR